MMWKSIVEAMGKVFSIFGRGLEPSSPSSSGSSRNKYSGTEADRGELISLDSARLRALPDSALLFELSRRLSLRRRNRKDQEFLLEELGFLLDRKTHGEEDTVIE